MRELEPFEALFRAVSDSQNNVQSWLTGSMVELNPEQVENEVDNMWRASYKFSKQYADSGPLLKLAESMKSTVGGFKTHVPLVTILCNGGLRDRHWEQFAEVVGFSIKPHDKTCLNDMIDRKLESYLHKMEVS